MVDKMSYSSNIMTITKRIIYKLSVAIFLVFILASFAEKRVYPYHIHPEQYPEANMRPTPPQKRSDYDNRLHIRKSGPIGESKDHDISSRGKLIRIEENSAHKRKEIILERKAGEWKRGGYRVRLAGFKIFRIKGLSSHNFNALVDIKGSYSDFGNSLYEKLGDHYIGMQFGESDASYLHLANGYIYGLSRTRREHYLEAQKYIEHYGNHTGNRTSFHLNKGLSHYWGKAGFPTVMGAQIFYRGTISPTAHYAWMRGAAKQYGFLLEGSISSGTKWGGKDWISDRLKEQSKQAIIKAYGELVPFPTDPRKRKKYTNTKAPAFRAMRLYYRSGPEKGASLSYSRRVAMHMYLMGATYIGSEMGHYERVAKGEKPIKMSPLGKMFNDIDQFAEGNPDPGVMQTQVALLLDFGCGWSVPERRKKQYRSWTCLPYSKGDHLTHNLVSLFYPNYELVGAYKNQRFALTDTPYGDILDVLLSDARPNLLERYSLIILSSTFEQDFNYLRHKLHKYLINGGSVIATGMNAMNIWPSLTIGNKEITIAKGTIVEMLGNQTSRIKRKTSILTLGSLPENAQIIAKINNRPAAFRITYGKGNLIVILSPEGINKQAQKVDWETTAEDDDPGGITHAYYLDAYVTEIIVSEVKRTQLFSVSGGDLMYVINHKGKGDYLIGIFNDTFKAQDFKIDSHIGTIKSIREIEVPGSFVKDTPGYYPYRLGKIPERTNKMDKIEGGDLRFFRVDVDEKGTKILPELRPEKELKNKYLAFDSIFELKNRIVLWPSFFDYFDGIKLNAGSLFDSDLSKFSIDLIWFNNRKVPFIIDASDVDDVERLEELALYTEHIKNLKTIIVSKKNIHSVQSLIKNVALLSKEDKSINIITEGAQIKKNLSGIEILNLNYEEWDILFEDIIALWISDKKIEKLKGKKSPTKKKDIFANSKVRINNKNRILTIRRIRDIKSSLMKYPSFFNDFGGIKIDSEYLRNASLKKCMADADWMQQKRLRVIVDFSPYINGYTNITFQEQQGVTYKASLSYIRDVFNKMKRMKITDALICSTKPHKKDGSDILPGLIALCESAESNRVKVHFQNTSRFDSAKVKKIIKKVNKHRLVPAYNIMEPSAINPAVQSANNMLILAYGNEENSYLIPYPFYMHDGKERIRRADDINNRLLVFEADYQNYDEIKKDLSFFKRGNHQ